MTSARLGWPTIPREVLEETKYAERKVKYEQVGQRHYYFMSLSGTEVRPQALSLLPSRLGVLTALACC